MVPNIAKEKFNYYRKWFRAFLAKEFIGLPYKYQDRFIVLVEKFLQDCKKIHSEHESLKEYTVVISVIDIQVSEKNKILTGKIVESLNQTNMKIIVPKDFKAKKDSKIRHIVYSLDGKTWYSSKKQLLTGKF